MIEVRRAAERGYSNLGWLSSWHTFSFADYYDPAQVGFSDLLVINDDTVMPVTGFGTHPHRDMEIFSYVLEGELEHCDSMGNGSVIRAGDVQMMSAGKGIRHSEVNPSHKDVVHFLQIWIAPDRKGVTPRYEQKHFGEELKRGRFCMIVSPDQTDGSLPVYQDIRVYAANFDLGESGNLELSRDRYAYVHVARGSLAINGIKMGAGDGARIRREASIQARDGTDAEVIVFDLRPCDAVES